MVAAFSSNNFICKEAKKEACIDATSSCSAIFSTAYHWFGNSEFQGKPFRGPGMLIPPDPVLLKTPQAPTVGLTKASTDMYY